MNHRRRPRTGQRRDGGVRLIKADEIRYPGVELPVSGDNAVAAETGYAGLRPARDTGFAVEGRRAREARRRAARQRRTTAMLVVGVAVLGALALGWQYTSDRQAASDPLTAPVRRASAPSADQPIARAVTRSAPPTPVFATYKGLELHLPVAVKDLTEVGFHQASYSYALHMKTPLGKADMDQVKKERTTNRDVASQPTEVGATLVGDALTMWRSRPGKPDSAADVGADPGSDVFAPVTGTVVKIKRFKLYGKYDDIELHIRPEGRDDVDCVMIHIDDVSVAPGDPVVAGITRIAAIRELDKRVNPQLKRFTTNGGHHAHLQLNDVNHPEYKGLKDAITVPES